MSAPEPITDPGYDPHDVARIVPETHSSSRTAFQRDRARVLHASAWRRLAAKTQVLSPTAGIDFARNRLTHSLEVAQIGRELAVSLGASPDVVDTACLTHDMGHPPFGHNGERALDEWITDFGGFEGNAQTLRVLARLEAKVFDASGESRGLNLTRASLDASCKYPWGRVDEQDPLAVPRRKFGYFGDDTEVFQWLREGAQPERKCLEAQLMDLSDDIAYSVHDFEDAIYSEYIDPAFLTARSGHESLLTQVTDWANGSVSYDAIASAFERIASEPRWLTKWDGSRQDQAKLKNFTSDMIGRFARASIRATREAASANHLTRYNAEVIVPEDIRAEIAVLKGVVAAFVMQIGRRQPTYARQRNLLNELLDTLWQDPAHLDPAFANDFRSADDEATARRAVVDQVASLTDQGAIAWYERLVQVPLV